MDQDVCLFSRKRMQMSGILAVESFSDEQITLESELGMIAVDGKNLKIESFSTDRGDLFIVGEIDSFYYYTSDKTKKSGRFFSNFFK